MSDIEHEGKILQIDVEALQKKFAQLGVKMVGDYTFRRYVFDIVPAQKGTWVRLRTNGTETTLTVKQIASNAIDGTHEWEVGVSDFDTTLEILKKSGLTPKGYQENRRIEYAWQGAMLCIDYWPKLQPYLEIETEAKEEVKRIASELGFSLSELTGDNTMKLYAKQGIDLDQVAELKF
ncbi:MAG TPA: CYTH domain-containing protein [Candidatus Saccharimonadales bacterium]|nr:CYTH domain-containing protein [Candidatus Saccharimonadales bacterium]